MEKEMITLKDIAKATGYSSVSVHRAIYNKEGLKPETRKKILDTVEAMGYKVNYLASSLKRKTINIAYIGKKTKSAQGYHAQMAKGAHDAFIQFEGMNIKCKDYFFEGKASELEDKECDILEEVFNSSEIDGVLILPIDTSIHMQLAIQKIIGKGIPVVLVDDYFDQMDFLCAVAPFYTLAGRTAAEFLGNICKPGKILVSLATATSKGTCLNYKGFSQYLKANHPEIQCETVEDPFDENLLVDRLVERIDDSVVGLYSVCERNSPALCKAALKAKRKDLKILGFDLSNEDIQFLKTRVFTGVIDTDPYLQGFLGFRVLLEYMLKNTKPSARILSVPIAVVMHSNLPFFETKRIYGIHVTDYRSVEIE